jgi:rRNA maturation protein Rpf1
MGELRKELIKQFCIPNPMVRISQNVLTPRNCEPISFSFKTNLKAKAVGELSKKLNNFLMNKPNSMLREPMTDMAKMIDLEEEVGHNYMKVSGIITKKGSDIRVMKEWDVAEYTYLQPWYCILINWVV